ncbi:hypothetical protein FHEFKHOI_00938 [Candidatus Methanoperedenaceae archaeon GB50]|nr:hypothetical protein FHEFKHOI_00938 [Candidatus Methanoperedenaceae archaeon GB50]
MRSIIAIMEWAFTCSQPPYVCAISFMVVGILYAVGSVLKRSIFRILKVIYTCPILFISQIKPYLRVLICKVPLSSFLMEPAREKTMLTLHKEIVRVVGVIAIAVNRRILLFDKQLTLDLGAGVGGSSRDRFNYA